MKLGWLVPAALVAAILLLSFAAMGQGPGGGFPGGGRGGMGGGTGGNASRSGGEMRSGTGARSMDPAQELSFQLVELEEDLKLAADQRKLYAAYADKLRQLADDMSRNRARLRYASGSASQQFDVLADSLRNKLTAYEDIADAGKALYGSLDSTQREIADRRLARVSLLLVDTNAMSGGMAGMRGETQKGR